MKAIKSVIIALWMLLQLLATAKYCYGAVLKTGNDSTVAHKTKAAADNIQQYTVSIAATSEDLKWTAIRKWYYRNSDTILIFHHKSVQKPAVTLHKMTQLQFMNQDLLLASGNGKAEFYDLKLKTKQDYANVSQVAALKWKGKQVLYAVVHQNGNAEIYGPDSKVIHRVSGVKSMQALENVGFFIHHQESGKSQVTKISAAGSENLYTTEKEIRKLSITDDQQFAAADESGAGSESGIAAENKKSRQLAMIDLNTGKVSYLPVNPAETFDEFEITAIGKSGTYLFSTKNQVKPENEMLEIWTGNESNIQSLYKNTSHRNFYIWKSQINELESLHSDPDELFVAFTHSKYLLKYHPNAGNNYVFHYPSIHIRLYDISAKKEIPLGTFSGVDQGYPEIIYRKDGKYILGSADRENWELWNLETMTKTAVGGQKLKHPLYTKDGRSVYFDSDHGIWIYDINARKLSPLTSAGGLQTTTILNGEKIRQVNMYHFASHTLDLTQPILYKNFDFDNNRTGYFLLRKGKQNPVVPMTENRIKDIDWNPSFNRYTFLEENYHAPTQLITQENGMPAKAVYRSNESDCVAEKLRKEIITYKNKSGRNLRGTLYYPYPFDPDKQYPMVVKIYQVQRYYANEYMVKGDASYVAYDKRALVEKGYFVYEPDIMYGNEGTGKGALDCVDRAMDAVQNNRSIDFKKVALTGHSHGGYSTNYIATRSTRFATYISGAGNSDIVRSYFSYNRNFHTPFYMQFESGQYQMPSFLENKQMYFNNNPIHYVENVNVPILLWAGKKDENIFWEQVQEFYIGLKRNNKDVIALFYSKAGHDLGINTPEKADMHRRAAEWLDYFLKDKKEVEWINRQMRKKNDSYTGSEQP